MNRPALARLLAPLACVLVLAGCMSEAELRAAAEAQAEADRQECRGLGFEEGSEAFANCLLKLREIRAIDDQARAIDNAARSYPYAWGPYGWGPYGWPYWYYDD